MKAVKVFLSYALALIGLAACSPGVSPPPGTYQGIPLATTVPRPDLEPLPPLWLIQAGQAIPGTMIGYHLASGQDSIHAGSENLPEGARGRVTFKAGDPILIIGPTSITEFRAEFINGPPLYGQKVAGLKAVGKVEDELAVFTLEQRGYSQDQYLRAHISFSDQASGGAEYLWQLIPGEGSAPLPSTPVAPVDGPLPCEIAAAAPLPTVTPQAGPGDQWPPADWAPEALAGQADLVIRGLVLGPPTGVELPGTFPSAIVTDTPVQVACTLKGSPPGLTLFVRTDGGCVSRGGEAQECVELSHGARIKTGQEVILFLQHEGPDYLVSQGRDGGYTTHSGADVFRALGEDGVYEILGERASSGHFQMTVTELMARIAISTP